MSFISIERILPDDPRYKHNKYLKDYEQYQLIDTDFTFNTAIKNTEWYSLPELMVDIYKEKGYDAKHIAKQLAKYFAEIIEDNGNTEYYNDIMNNSHLHQFDEYREDVERYMILQ